MSIHEFVETHDIPGEIIFAKLWGSRSHNTHKEDSDYDYAGVYILPLDIIIGLNKYETAYTNAVYQPHYEFHEIGKYCSLLMKGNPVIFEMLWTDRDIITTKYWDELKENRDKFKTKTVVNAYLQYATDQLRRISRGQSLHTAGGDVNEKWLYHLLRLLGESERILSGEGPIVWKEGPERDFLMSVRYGYLPISEVLDIANDKLVKQGRALAKSALPTTCDSRWLNDWIIKLRKNY